MGAFTIRKQKIRPFKEILLSSPEHVIEGIYHSDLPDWKVQNRKLTNFMYVQANQMNLFDNKIMLPTWLLRCRNFILKEGLTHYQPRLRGNEEIKKLIN